MRKRNKAMDQANREEARNFKVKWFIVLVVTQRKLGTVSWRHGWYGDSVSTRAWSDDVACTRRGEAQVGTIVHKQGSPHKYDMVLHN